MCKRETLEKVLVPSQANLLMTKFAALKFLVCPATLSQTHDQSNCITTFVVMLCARCPIPPPMAHSGDPLAVNFNYPRCFSPNAIFIFVFILLFSFFLSPFKPAPCISFSVLCMRRRLVFHAHSVKRNLIFFFC